MHDPRPRTRWTLSLIALVATLALIAAACGDNGEDTGSGGNGGAGGNGTAPGECPVGAFEDADGVTEVTIWHGWVGLTQRTLEDIVEEYNASQDQVRVSAEAQGNYEELLAKFETALGDPSTLPDIILSEDTTLQFMIDSQQVVPAQSCIDADPEAEAFYDQVLPAVISGYTVEDVLWPAAFSVSQAILYINENHFREAGLSTETDDLPQTIDELRTAAETIAEAGVAGVGAPLVARLDSWYIENQLTGIKEELVDNANGRDGLATESNLDNEYTAEIYEWFQQMEADGLLNPIPYSQPYDQLFAMALGTSSMLIDTSTAITSVNGAIEGTLTNEDLGAEDLGIDLSDIQLEGLEIGVGLNPGLEQAGQGQIGGAGWYMVDTEDDAVLSASWDFLKFFNQDPNQVRWTLEGSYLPVSEAARSDAELIEEFESTRRGRWLAIASGSLDALDPDFPGPVIGPYNQLRATVRDSFEQIVLNGADVASTVTAADTAFQDELTRYANEVGG